MEAAAAHFILFGQLHELGCGSSATGAVPAACTLPTAKGKTANVELPDMASKRWRVWGGGGPRNR